MGRTFSPRRFWARCTPEPNTGCWLWEGAATPEGYGVAMRNGRVYRAHRLAAMLAWGVGLLPRSVHVCHHCDNPACINPSHLYAGDAKTNGRDKAVRGRAERGERRHNAKLTAAAVRDIRASSLSDRELGDLLGVSKHTVRAVRRGENWAHVG